MSIILNIKYEFQRRMYHESLPRIIFCLKQLDEKEIWYRPNEYSNSVGNLVLHLCGNINQYINSTLGITPDNRMRDHEFIPNQKISTPELIKLISAAINLSIKVVDNFSFDKPTEKIPVQCFTESPISIIIHVIEHTSYHVGQITWITKSIKNIDTAYYKDLNLNDKA